MKRKIIIFLTTLVTLFTLGLTTYAAEVTPEAGGEVVEPTPVKEAYTYTEGANVMVFALNGDGTGTMTITYEGQVKEGVAITYAIDNQLFTVLTINNKEVNDTFIINEDKTLIPTEYEKPDNPNTNATIVVVESEGGIIYVDDYKGMAGDLVELKIEATLFYNLKHIYVNGVEVLPNEDGKYIITLVEGDNSISYLFEVDLEKMQEIADLFDKIRTKSWDEIFTMENLMILINWVITLFCSSGFFVTLIKNKKIKTKTANEISDAVNEKVGTAITGFLTDTITPITDQMLMAFVDVKKIVSILTKCTILAQENTPESRIAILNELQKIQIGEDEELSAKVRKLIDDEITKNAQAVEARDEAIEELKKENEDIAKPHL